MTARSAKKRLGSTGHHLLMRPHLLLILVGCSVLATFHLCGLFVYDTFWYKAMMVDDLWTKIMEDDIDPFYES